VNKYLIVFILSFTCALHAGAVEEQGAVWKRTAKFRSLSSAEQSTLIKLYNVKIEEVADDYRAKLPAPMSIERDRAVTGISRCVVDSVLLQQMQKDPESAAAEAAAKRYLDSCGAAQGDRFIAVEWRGAHKVSALAYLLDYKELLGTTVAVKGSLLHRGQLTLLHPPGRPDAYIVVDIDELSRDERERILLDCASGCQMEVYGKVGNIVGQKGLAAIRIR